MSSINDTKGWFARPLGRIGPWGIIRLLGCIRLLVMMPWVALVLPGAGQAQPIAIATLSPGEGFHAVGTVVAKLVARETRIKVLVVPYGQMADVLKAVERRKTDFALAGVNEVIAAVNGQSVFQNRPLENLRIAANLMPLPVALFVRKSSRFYTIGELAGGRMPQGEPEEFPGAVFLQAILAASGMRTPDFKSVRVSRRYPALNRFLVGRLDAMVFSLDGPMAAKADAGVRGIRALPIPYTSMALLAMQEVRPAFYISLVMPGPRHPGVERPMSMLTTDLVLVVHRNVSPEKVRRLVGVIAENKAALVKENARFNDFSPRWMVKPFPGVEYHPAALRYHQDNNRLKKPGRNKPG